MNHNTRRLRRPEERVGHLTNADLPPPASIIDQDSLVALQIRAREEAVFQRLHDRYYDSLMRVAMNFVRSREEAEEVIQDTWIAVLSGIDRFEGRSTFKTWLFRILINRARSRAKREDRVIPFSTLQSTDDGDNHTSVDAVVGSFSSPDQSVLDQELAELLQGAVAALPRAQRIVISLRDIEGWSAEEVCEALDITYGNQRVLLHRARMKVRETLVPYFRLDDFAPEIPG